MTEVSVVLPVYNEEANLKPLHEEIKEIMEGLGREYEILYVDDGSSDGSFSVLEEITDNGKHTRTIKFRRNFGQSSALKAGFDNAEGDIVVAMDSDGQNDPKDIPKLIDKLEEGYDCVSGWRHDRNDPIAKRVASRLASALQKPFLGKTVHDYGCTLKAYRSEALKDLELYGEMHRYIPPLLRWKGYRVTEIKVNHRERKKGETKYGTKRLGKGFLDMLNVWFWQKFSQRPIHIFGGFGIVLGLFGLIAGFYTIYLKVTVGIDFSSHFLSIVSFLSLVLGVQFFTTGLLADISLKNYHASHNRDIYNIEKILE